MLKQLRDIIVLWFYVRRFDQYRYLEPGPLEKTFALKQEAILSELDIESKAKVRLLDKAF